MHFLSAPLLRLALDHFDRLQLNTEQSDWFFSTFGPGNLAKATTMPHERFNDYESLLNSLKKRNHQRYEQVHKGIPFFYLFWLAFDLRNYEKALYYLDASISEDVKNHGAKWIDLPGADVLRLTTGHHVAQRVIKEIRDLLNDEITRFNCISTLAPITIDEFITKFVAVLIQDPSARAIISACYVFLLETKERSIELQLRSTAGTSLGPIIANLFSGCLVFESLLKVLYPTNDNETAVKTIGKIFNTASFKADFGSEMQTSADTLQDIIDSIDDNSFMTAFSTTARLRNTTGHNLIWDNIFDSIPKYDALWHQIVNALLFLIERKYIR